MKKRLGEILLERGLIDGDQLNAALGHHRQWGMRLGTALVVKGFIAEGMLTRVLSETLGFPMVDLSRVLVDQAALRAVPRRLAEQHDVFPISLQDPGKGRKILVIAMADPLNATAIDEIGFTTDTLVKPAIAQISSLEAAIRRYYYGERNEIPPLSMEKRGSQIRPDDMMTILTGHSERLVGSEVEELQLTDEVVELPAIPLPAIPLPAIPAPPPFDPLGALRPPPEYSGQATGVFTMPTPSQEGAAVTMIRSNKRPAESRDLEDLEKKFWALMRILARRGLVSKDEFITELRMD